MLIIIICLWYFLSEANISTVTDTSLWAAACAETFNWTWAAVLQTGGCSYIICASKLDVQSSWETKIASHSSTGGDRQTRYYIKGSLSWTKYIYNIYIHSRRGVHSVSVGWSQICAFFNSTTTNECDRLRDRLFHEEIKRGLVSTVQCCSLHTLSCCSEPSQEHGSIWQKRELRPDFTGSCSSLNSPVYYGSNNILWVNAVTAELWELQLWTFNHSMNFNCKYGRTEQMHGVSVF